MTGNGNPSCIFSARSAGIFSSHPARKPDSSRKCLPRFVQQETRTPGLPQEEIGEPVAYRAAYRLVLLLGLPWARLAEIRFA